MKDKIDLLARILLASIFFLHSYDLINHYFGIKEKVAASFLPGNGSFWLISAIVLLIFGSILLLIGYRSKFGVVLLLIYFIPITFYSNQFWNVEASIKHTTAIEFVESLAIIGGLFMVYVNGSGKYSIKRLFATTKVKKGKGLLI